MWPREKRQEKGNWEMREGKGRGKEEKERKERDREGEKKRKGKERKVDSEAQLEQGR